MQSILIIDTPKNCDECDLCRSVSIGNSMCIPTGALIGDGAEIDESCPLRPLPQYQVANNYDFECYTNGISVGWNQCLEKITGEVPNYAKSKGHEPRN